MIAFDVIILLLSLIARKKCTKVKYVLFTVLYVIMLLVNAISALDYLYLYPRDPHMAKFADPVMGGVCVAGFVIDIIGLCLLRSWRIRYLKATLSEAEFERKQKNSWKTTLVLLLLPFVIFAALCAVAIMTDGSLPFATPAIVAALFAVAAGAWLLLFLRARKKGEMGSGDLLAINLAAGIAVCCLIVLLAYPLAGSVGTQVCPSCGQRAKLITQTDKAGDVHTWCKKCWDDYWAIMR